MLNKIKKCINKINLIILIIILVLIIALNIFNKEIIIYDFNSILLITYSILYILFLIFLYKKVIPKIENNKIIVFIILAIMLIICIKSSYDLQVNYKDHLGLPTWDMGEVHRLARGIANNKYTGIKYLSLFPNNIPITMIYILVFKIALLINKNINLLNVATTFNAIIVYLTILFTYLTSKEIFSKRKSMMLLFILLCTTPLYMYTAIYYTDTISMLITILILYLYLKMRKKTKNVFIKIVLGIILALGTLIKITSIFIFVAIIIFSILQKDTIKRIKQLTIPTIIAIIIVFGYTKCIKPKYIMEEDINIPINYWILVGLKENGNYNYEDINSALKKDKTEEKEDYIDEQIQERLKEYNLLSFTEHIIQKIHFAWADGTYYAPEKLSREPTRMGLIHEFILPERIGCKYYKYIPQVMHIGMIFLILIDAIHKIKIKDIDKDEIIIDIVMLIMIMFLIIWENRSRYVITILPTMIILSIGGIDILSNNIDKLEKKYKEINIKNL